VLPKFRIGLARNNITRIGKQRWNQVHLDTLGESFVADEDAILGPRGMRLTKSGRLLGHILAQYIDGDNEDLVRTECVLVDLSYIEDALPKHRAYLHRQDKVTPHHNRYPVLHPTLTLSLTRLGLATLDRDSCSPLKLNSHCQDKVNPHHDHNHYLHQTLTIARTQLGLATLDRHS
jgi:hypothetical protein